MYQKLFKLFGKSKIGQFIAAIVITTVLTIRSNMQQNEPFSFSLVIFGILLGVLAGLALTSFYYLFSFLFTTVGGWFIYAKYIKGKTPFVIDSFSITNLIFIILGITFFIIGTRKLKKRYNEIQIND